MNLEKLSIVPLEIIDDDLVKQLLLKLEEIFELTTEQITWDSVTQIEKFDFKTGQKYRSTELINYFSTNIPEKTNMILFITTSDL